MWRHSLLAVAVLALFASGCGANHHRSVRPRPQPAPGYSLAEVKSAFAEEGVSLSVFARDHRIVFLQATTPDFTDSINVQIRPPERERGRILVLVPGGHRLVWARNVVVDFNPASEFGLKARAAVARLRRTRPREG